MQNNIIEKLENHAKFGIDLSLERVNKVLFAMGNPQEQLEVIHIAGTNGKGSVSNYIYSALRANGYSVGKYCSPYLENVTEMFTINEKQISLAELDKYYRMIEQQSEQLNISLTLYEVTTVIMFLFSCDSKIDYLVLEVGLGGRLDATNVVNPAVSVITNISLDHTAILGDTIEKIAYEKAGIIKPNVPLFTTCTQPEVLEIFKKKADDMHIVDTNYKFNLDFDNFLTKVEIDDIEYQLGLFGEHQVENFVLARAVLKYLKIDDNIIKKSCTNVKNPGRLERVTSNIIFDGAHNPQAARKLVKTLSASQRDINIIFSILEDKDVVEIVSIFKNLTTNLTFIPLPSVERGLSKDMWLQYQIPNVKVKDSIEDAIQEDSLNIVCGTFKLYPELKQYIANKKTLI